jgi:Fe-S cluster assembly iron-binding protein IscA
MRGRACSQVRVSPPVGGCTFFRTTVEFLPILQRQHDDAAAKRQRGQQIFDNLLARLKENAS